MLWVLRFHSILAFFHLRILLSLRSSVFDPSNPDSRSLELIRGNKSRWKNVRLMLIQRKNGGSLRDNRGEGRVGWQSVEASKPRLDTGDLWRFTIHEEVTEERRDRYLNERCRPV